MPNPTVKKTPKTSNELDDIEINESKMDRKLEELIQPKFDQMQQVCNLMQQELGKKMMKAVEDQLSTQLTRLAQQFGQGFPAAQPVKKESTTPMETPNPPRKLFPATTIGRTPPPPPPLPADDVLNLVKEKFSKESIVRAANSTVVLQNNNGEIFISRFMDYMETLGLKQALLATRVQCIDPQIKKPRKQVKVELLLYVLTRKHHGMKLFHNSRPL